MNCSAALVARVQTFLSLLAFSAAFIIGCSFHYQKIVKNGVAGYPEEWLPSVSATIGDWYPERNVFQILIALTAAPRFAILVLTYNLHRSTSLSIFGVLRTLSCGGWVYITSNDSGTVHDLMMIGYMILNIPWMAGNTLMSKSTGVRRARTAAAMAFFATLVPLVHFYIQHKVHRIPGAYSSYAIFEWSLIIFDILFDSIAERELRETGIHITLGTQPTTEIIPSVVTPTPKFETKRRKESQHEEILKRSDGALKGTLESPLAAPSVTITHGTSLTTAGQEDISWRTPVSFVSDLYRSYVFWSLFTALIPTLFYFSVWELGIAGHELALLTLLTPAFLSTTPFFLPLKTSAGPGMPTWFQMLTGKRGQIIAYLVQYTALGIWVSKSPAVRLIVVGMGCAVMVQREVVLWAGLVGGEGSKEGRDKRYWNLVGLLGFVCASWTKHVHHGNNPIWPFIDPNNGGRNKTGLALALLSLAEFATRADVNAQPNSRSKIPTVKTKVSRPSYLTTLVTASLPLGSLLFSLHNLLADPSTLVAASWTGWEDGKPRGPLPHVFGVVTMMILCLGIAVGINFHFPSPSQKRGVKTWSTISHQSPLWWLMGCAGAYGMYKERNWEGYGSGLVLAFVLASVAPRVFMVAAEMASIGQVKSEEAETEVSEQGGQVAKVYAGAMLVYILLNLASIFTVAYAFVPGGWMLRERTDAVLVTQLVCLAPAFSWPGLRTPPVAIGDPGFDEVEELQTSATRGAATKKYAYITLTVLSVLSIFGTLSHLPLVPPRPFKQGSSPHTVINAGIWTVHFGLDNEGHDSQRGIRELVKDMELDVVGLLETDLHRTAFGHRDLTRVLVEDLGYNVDIGPGPNEHTWGAVLLSKFPIINTTHHLLPSPAGELAPAIEAVLDVYGVEITVVVAHNGQEEDKLDRQLQSTELARIMAASSRPVIFLGYVVTRPHALRRKYLEAGRALRRTDDNLHALLKANPYEIVVNDGNMHDIDKDDSDRWCEYIFYRGLYRTAYARVSRGIITDTELQIGQFVIPRLGTNVTDESLEARYRRTRKEELGQEHWFPMEYYGNEQEGGKNGHFYHVFYTPLYYLLPEGAVV